MAGGAVKKPVTLPSPAGAPKFTVTSQQKTDDIGIQTLVGDYADKGENHGKRFYQKIQKIPGHEDIKVFLYYWDTRDGADFSGWWFGDQVGGTQVWARCPASTPTPPRIGWKVPWDSPIAKPGVLFVDPHKGAAAASSPTVVTPRAGTTPAGTSPAASPAATASSPAMPLVARVKKATTQVEAAEKAATAVVTRAKTSLAAKAAEAVLKTLQADLTKQQVSLGEAQKNLTQDITEARKGGVAATSSVTELSKLSPRIRAAQAGVVEQLNKVKAALTTKPAAPVQTPAQKEQQKQQEEKDAKDLETSLPAAKELTSAAEECVTAISSMADPILADPPADDSEVLKKAFEEIEAAATEAQTKITEARTQITQKLQAARGYAAETRKTALTEYSALQTKLTETQKKLMPFRTFKKDFKSKVSAKKALAELTEKVGASELEVEKAAMMSIAAESGQMSEEDITNTEKAATPASTEILALVRTIDQKMTGAQGAMKEELMHQKERAMGLKKKCEGVIASMRTQRYGLSAQKIAAEVGEKVAAVEEAMTACQDAEMPFLKGIEVLPPDESTKALTESQAASAKAEAALNQARAIIRTKQAESKKFPKELMDKATSELSQFSTRLEGTAKKLAEFKKETVERKVNAMMAEVMDVIKEAEKKCEEYTKVAKVFSDDLNTVSVEALKEAQEKVGDAEKAATAALAEARKQLAAKQKDTKGNEATVAFSKLQGKLSAAQGQVAQSRKGAMHGEKLIKGKEVLAAESTHSAKVEEDVSKAEKSASPLESGGELNDEALAELGDLLVTAQNTVKSKLKSLESHLITPVPTLKAALTKVADTYKKAQERLDKILAGDKGQRERCLGEAYVRDAKKKTEEVDKSAEKVNEAELPFLKGIEVLPLTEATSTLDLSDKVIAELDVAIKEARNFIAAKNLEVKNFTNKEKSKPLAEELNELSGRVNAAATKLGQFKKDTDSRKKTALLQEAGEKIKAADEEVAKVTEAATPLFGEDAASMTSEQVKPICEKASELAKKAQAVLDEARTFLAMRAKDCNIPSLKDALKTHQTKLSEVTAAQVKAKKAISEQEQKFIGKKLLGEAEELVNGLEAEVKAAEEACAKLLEKGGEEFLVLTSIKTLTAALREHMKEKSLDLDGLFKEVSGKKKSITKEAFLEYLQKLPEAIGHPEVGFKEERRAAIFAVFDSNGDGKMTAEEFKAQFKQRFVCSAGISVTDVLEVSKSKTTGKLEVKEAVEAIGEIVKDDATGVERVEVKILSSDKTGFVTVKGNQGTTYLQAFIPFNDFCLEMDKAVEERVANVRKALQTLSGKTNELTAAGSSPPIVEAKAEMAKLKPKATAFSQQLQTLKTKVSVAKKEWFKTELSEKNAHIEEKEKKEADAITGPVAKDLEDAEALAKKVEDAAEPLVTLKAEEVFTFEKPASLLKELEGLVPTATAALQKVKTAATEEQKQLLKAIKGPKFEAKKELQKMQLKADAASRKCSTTMQAVKKACQTLVEKNYAKTATALLAQVQKDGVTPEKLFEQLAGEGNAKIPEAALCKRLLSLEGLDLKEEMAQLICRKMEADGVGKRSFMSFVQRYYSVTTGIAITSEFEISKGKTIRKAEVEEVFEVLEGPVSDEKVGLTRLKGRSLGDSTEGWISIKGNQGSIFLKETEKPFYTISGSEEVQLDSDFKISGSTAVKKLKPGEVMEMLEGPKKEVMPPGLKARGKAMSDNAIGWFTIRDKQGNVFAEAEGKFYTCTSAVAMTDNLDIKDCNVIKKLTVGELFNAEEGPVVQEEQGISRVKGKTSKDDKVGWITIKGNAGTVYATASTKHYAVVKEVPMHKTMAANAPEVRKLEVGEAIQVVEGPKEEAHLPAVRIKVKASDGATGWVTLAPTSVKKWNGNYRCNAASTLQTTCKVDGAEAVRDVALGEAFELLEGPTQEAGFLRMKAKAKKDSAIGWITIIDESGKRLMV